LRSHQLRLRRRRHQTRRHRCAVARCNEARVGGPNEQSQRTITLTEDNFCDYLTTDFAESLVADLEIRPGGLDPNDGLVTRFLAWLAWESSGAADVSYEMSRPAATSFLELVATQPDTPWDDDD
jgi:hypothetical protein